MRRRRVLFILGAVLALVGLLWIGQGLGHVRWPETSFMIGEAAWVNYGAVFAAIGLVLILVARRIR